MNKSRKLWIALPFAVLSFLVIALLLATLFIDPNDYRKKIEQVAESSANIDLQINGEISWSLFPWVGFDINQIDIYTLQPTQKTEFIHIEQASAQLKLWPLIRQKIEVDALVLNGFRLNLRRDQDGHANWESIFPEPSPKPGSSKSTKSDSDAATDAQQKSSNIEAKSNSESDEEAGFSVKIGRVAIENAQIHFEDLQADQQLELALTHFLASDINQENTFPIELAFTLKNQTPALSAELEMSTMMGISRGGYALYLKELLIEGELAGQPFSDKTVPIEVHGDLAFDRKSDSFNIKSLALKVANFPIVLQLAGEKISTKPVFNGSIRIAKFNPQVLASSLGMPLPILNNLKALTDLSMKANLVGSANQWALNEFKLNIDQSTLSGKLGVSGLEHSEQLPHLAWNLELNYLDLDDYLPKNKLTESESKDESKDSADQPLPLEMLRALNVNGEVKIGTFKASGIELSNLRLKTQAKDGNIQINPLQAELYQGLFELNAQAMVGKNHLTATLTPEMSGVQIKPLLSSVASVELLEGAAELNGALEVTGATVGDLINSLTGKGRFEIVDGALIGTNLTEKVCKGVDAISKTPSPKYNWSANSEFQQLGGSFTVTQGVIETPDMAIDLSSLKVSGEGKVDLPKSALDYRLFLTVQGEQGIEGCAVSEKWQDFRWPVRCKGAFDDAPTSLCKVDSAEITRQLGNKLKKKAKQKAKQKIEKKLKSKLKNLFKGF